MTEKTSLLEAQRRHMAHFTMQDMWDPDQFRAKVQLALFQPYYEARRLHKGGPLPDIKVDLSSIGREKPSTDGKEFYQCFIHFSSEVAPRKDTFSRMALGNQLMDKLSWWTFVHTTKPLMDVTITKAGWNVLYEFVNIALHPQCMKKAACYYSVNQAIMDMIADNLIFAWSPYSTNFVLHTTLHDD